MDIISKQTLIDLIERCQGTAISIYMPTFVKGRETNQNSIRLKNLVERAKIELEQAGIGTGKLQSYLSPLISLVDDANFWQNQDEGLALFLDSNELSIFRLPERFEEIEVVGDNFHITPLIPFYEGNGEYYLLSLSQDRPKIYQGSKFKLLRINELDLPESLQKLFDEYYEFHSHLQFHTKSVNPNPDIAADRRGMFFGQGGDDIDKNAEIRNFFHRFDHALADYLEGYDIPLVLAGVEYLHPLYREANTFPSLIEEGITKNVSQMDEENLQQLAWQIVENKYQANLDEAVGVYQKLKQKNGDTDNDIETIVSSAYFKRVHTLFVDETKHVWGVFNPKANKVSRQNTATHENQDLLSMAATYTLINGGEVLVISQEKMPDESPAAAILRY